MGIFKVIGPPGTGKTTFMLNRLEEELKTYPSEKIAFVSFTRKGSYEGVERAIKRFKLTNRETPYFRTIHSICFNMLNITRDNMVNTEHYKELMDKVGIPLSTPDLNIQGVPLSNGAKYIRACQMRDNNPEVHATYTREMNIKIYDYVEKNYIHFKEQRGLFDFTDILKRYLKEGQTLPVKVAFIDEAQDLTPLQWKVVEKMFSGADKIYFAGDDDQGIYAWAGADVKRFINMPTSLTLDHSYRLPRSIHAFANKIVHNISNRNEKQFSPRDEEGILDICSSWSLSNIDPKEKTLILARTSMELNRAEKYLRSEGINYVRQTQKGDAKALNKKTLRAIVLYETFRRKHDELARKTLEMYREYFISLEDFTRPWYEVLVDQEEAAFIRRMRQRKINPEVTPKVRLSTIHGAKGAESDRVVLALDMSRRTYKTWLEFMDNELRTYYVGATRAKCRLTLKLKEQEYGYPANFED